AGARIVAVERSRVNVAAARITDDAVAGLGKDRLLVDPDESAAGRRMHQHDRRAGPARVPIPELRTGKLRDALLGRDLWGDRDGRHRIGALAVGGTDRTQAGEAHSQRERGAGTVQMAATRHDTSSQHGSSMHAMATSLLRGLAFDHGGIALKAG